MQKTCFNAKIINMAVILILSLCMTIYTGAGLMLNSQAMELEMDAPPAEFKRILILNSYDEGYRWTSEQSNAIKEQLEDQYEDILIYVEYMDTKYHPEKDNWAYIYELYRHKYHNIKLDLIFTTDNDALEFATEHRKEIFSDAPVVFSGVTKDAASTILKGQDNVVGVFEITDPAGTMKAAKGMNPEISKVYVIHDNTSTGKNSMNQLLDDHIQDNYELIFLNMLPIGRILDTISKLDHNSIVLLCAYTVDASGYKIPADKFAEMISEASSVPVFDMWNFRLGSGVLGGSLLSGTTMGVYAAELGSRILEGASADQIQSVNDKVVEHIYDYEQMERFDIDLDKIPEGSTVVNRPFSFYETYQWLVNGTLIAFAVLLIYILVLIKNIKDRKKAEKAASEANFELSALYEQLYAVDQQIKLQLEELSVAHEKLRHSEEKYRMVAEATNDVIWDWDVTDDVIRYSGGLKGVLGYDDDEIIRKEDWYRIVAPEDIVSVREESDQILMNESKVAFGEYRVRHKDGRTVWISSKAKIIMDENARPSKIVGSHTDITILKEYQNRIWEMAYFDELTQLPNRAYLKEYINNKMKDNTSGSTAIFYIDIDDFNAINDNFGHSEGDKLLIAVGNMLREITEEGNLVFRQGGDEFVVVLNHIHSRDDVSDYIAKLNAKFENSITLSEGEFHITLSGGIVVYPLDGNEYDTLMKNADIAMYFVKNNGKNGLMFYNKDMEEGSKEKLLQIYQLRAAVKEMNFSLHYQPIIDSNTGRICKFEALIRWYNPESGQVPPAVFIKLAEENGLIVPIGDWVMRESCLFAARLASNGYSDVAVSINISPIQLRQKDFVQNIEETLAQTGVEPERIELEITESILIDSMDLSLKKLHELRELGISISLDDFGQGYSSLTYLRMLPINTLKIDKAFLNDNIDADRNSQIICSIIELAHGLQLRVVAEGVETEEQLEFLKRHDCDQIQGYLISRPVTEENAVKMLE